MQQAFPAIDDVIPEGSYLAIEVLLQVLINATCLFRRSMVLDH
jgi:hypothetical protein